MIAISQNINHIAIGYVVIVGFVLFILFHISSSVAEDAFDFLVHFCGHQVNVSKWVWILSLQRNSIYVWFCSDRKNNFSLADVVQWQHQWFSMMILSSSGKKTHRKRSNFNGTVKSNKWLCTVHSCTGWCF